MGLMKCVFGVTWTSGIVSGVITWLLFTFVDPAGLMNLLQPAMPEETFRIEMYAGTFLLIWALLNASVYLNCFFSSLREQREGHGQPQA